jgi:hypothetical protein
LRKQTKETQAKTMKKKLAFISISLLISLAAVAPAKAESLVMVLGLDESGSYHLRQQSMNMAKSVIAQMEGGDVLYIRRITSQSYKDDGSAIMRLELRPTPPKSKNFFDRKARATRERVLLANARMKKKAMAVISGLKQKKAAQTDVWGFLSAAQERLHREKARGQRLLILATDMQDTVGRSTNLELTGVHILVVSFEGTTSPKATQSIRSHWRKIFMKAGAEAVEFWPADMPVKIR